MTKVAELILVVALMLCPAALAESASPYAVAANAREDGLLISWHYPGINRATVNYHHWEADHYFLVIEEVGDNRAAVRFTDFPANAAWEQVAIYLWGDDPFPEQPGEPTSPFNIAIYDSTPTSTSSPLWNRDTNADSLPLAGGWFEIPVHQELGTQDSAWVQFQWLRLTPTAPLPAVDFTGEGNTHSYYSRVESDQTNWQPLGGMELLIHATMTNTDTLLGIDRPESLPDSFMVYMAAVFDTAGQDDTTRFSISDSLHFLLEPGVCEDCRIWLTAWSDETESAPTEPIQLSPPEILPPPLELRYPEINEFLGVDELREIFRPIKNTWTDTIEVLAEIDSCSWLELVTESYLFPPGETGYLELKINTTGIDPGSYKSEVRLISKAAGVIFENLLIPVVLEVEEPTAVSEQSLPDSSTVGLSQNFPNPFNSTTTIFSSSPEPILIFDILGRRVDRLEASTTSGAYRFTWNSRTQRGIDLPSGLYFYRQHGSTHFGKMLLIK